MVLWSNKSIKSDWVKEEATIGKRRQILVPVRIDSVDPPLGFGLIQAADLTDWEPETSHAGFELFLSAISDKGEVPMKRKDGGQIGKISISNFERQSEVQPDSGDDNHEYERVNFHEKKDDLKPREWEERKKTKTTIKIIELFKKSFLHQKPESLKLTKSKIIKAILFFFLSFFIAISLLSFSPADPSINNAGAVGQIHNLFGFVGAHISGLIIGLFGIGAFWIPILLFLSCIHVFGDRSKWVSFLGFIGAIILVVLTGSILSLKQNHFTLFGNMFSAGGIIGIPFKVFLVQYTNTTGATIIMFLMWIIGFILVGGFSLITLIQKGFRHALYGFERLK